MMLPLPWNVLAIFALIIVVALIGYYADKYQNP